MKAFTKDILRTIRGSLKRFVSIAVICALGVTMLSGLSVACIDLRESADELFDAQKLFDISVQSTLGLTSADIDALASVDGVELVEGAWQESAYTRIDGRKAPTPASTGRVTPSTSRRSCQAARTTPTCSRARCPRARTRWP